MLQIEDSQYYEIWEIVVKVDLVVSCGIEIYNFLLFNIWVWGVERFILMVGNIDLVRIQ